MVTGAQLTGEYRLIDEYKRENCMPLRSVISAVFIKICHRQFVLCSVSHVLPINFAKVSLKLQSINIKKNGV
jgi:hypothetical protein